MVDEECYYNGTPSSCLDLKNDSVLEILSALAPNCERGAWTPLTIAWKLFFYLEISASALLFLLLGVVCLILLFKRQSAQRFKAKTFVAIDMSLAILGFSRFLFYVFDPFGISGFCDGHIGCVVTSRLLFALGFPSLTAAYTLVFITLWYSAKMRLGRNCIQHWKIIIPLCFIHYFVAIVVETIGAVGSYSVVFLVLSCEAIFTLWGLFVCLTFLVAGCRLLHTIKTSVRNSSVVCREKRSIKEEEQAQNSGTASKTNSLRTYSVTRMKLRTKKHHKQAIRKITIITYIAATLGGLYSLLSLVQLVMACLQLFSPCPEKDSRTYHSNSDMWLGLRYISTSIEYSLAVLLVYSINDFRPVIRRLRTCFCLASVEDEKQSKNKYFTYSCEETSESSTGFHKKKMINKSDTKTSIRFSPPLTPTDNKSIKSPNVVENNGEVKETDLSNNANVIPDIGDVENGSVSISKSEVQFNSCA